MNVVHIFALPAIVTHFTRRQFSFAPKNSSDVPVCYATVDMPDNLQPFPVPNLSTGEKRCRTRPAIHSVQEGARDTRLAKPAIEKKTTFGPEASPSRPEAHRHVTAQERVSSTANVLFKWLQDAYGKHCLSPRELRAFAGISFLESRWTCNVTFPIRRRRRLLAHERAVAVAAERLVA